MNLYRYEITIYDEDARKERTYAGFTFGNTYADALAHLTKYYGEDEIIAINNLAWVADRPLVEIPKAYSIDDICENNAY